MTTSTTHRLLLADARDLSALDDGAVQLVVTSPPYPMIAMWDAAFAEMDPAIGDLLAAEDGPGAFEAMHRQLDAVWAEVARVLSPGGWACVNLGDATRTLGGGFRLYPNHARALTALQATGLHAMPDILWRKPTNGPTKFMGSGMLPAGAYVTYEHEYILVLRKGGKRAFRSADDKARRRRSAFFWEERNAWFSDLWADLRGVRQALPASQARDRSAAFPFELPFRLVQMYACQGDLVLDPFAGTGTTLAAAVATGRSSVGVERDPALAPLVAEALRLGAEGSAALQAERLAAHRAFLADREARGKPVKHHNAPHDVPVMTSQERQLTLLTATDLRQTGPHAWAAEHAPSTAPAPSDAHAPPDGVAAPAPPTAPAQPQPGRQAKLW